MLTPTRTHIHSHRYPHTHTHTQSHIYSHLHTYTHMHIHIYTPIHTHTHSKNPGHIPNSDAHCMCVCACVCVLSCSVMSDSLRPRGLCSPPGSSVHGTFQARILEWIAISSSRGSSLGDLPYPGIKPRSLAFPAVAGRFFTNCTTWEAPLICMILAKNVIHSSGSSQQV